VAAALVMSFDATAQDYPADLTRVKAVYEHHCQSCHGLGGDGDGPAGASLKIRPADFHRFRSLLKSDEELLFQESSIARPGNLACERRSERGNVNRMDRGHSGRCGERDPREPVQGPLAVFGPIHRDNDVHPRILIGLGLDRDLQDAVPTLAEDPVSFDNVLECNAMSDQWSQIEPAMSHQFQ
jgi:hypothetical protein